MQREIFKVVNIKTGDQFLLPPESIDFSKINRLLKTQDLIPDEKIVQFVKNLNISAEIKAMLVELKNIVVYIGPRILKLGKRILEIILYLLNKYPNTSQNLIIALVIGLSLNLIPIIGSFLSSFLTPILVALGVSLGFLKDLQQMELKNEVENLIKEQLVFLNPKGGI